MICHHQQCFLPPNILLIFIIFIGRQQLISTAVEHKEWWMGGDGRDGRDGGAKAGHFHPKFTADPNISTRNTTQQRVEQRLRTVWPKGRVLHKFGQKSKLFLPNFSWAEYFLCLFFSIQLFISVCLQALPFTMYVYQRPILNIIRIE